jgi:hypothetical protein
VISTGRAERRAASGWFHGQNDGSAACVRTYLCAP